MKKYILVFIMISLLFNIDVSFSKMGFGKSTGFRSYKSYKFYKKQKTLKQRNYKQKLTQKKISTNRRPSFLNNPIFRWLIGGMIFGALLSFLLGYGFHIGAPGLLEILLIVGIIYFLFKKFKTSYQPTPETTAGIPVPEEEKKEEIPIS
ncbi:MAG: Tim44 domain-containing protein, partial [Aquificota bacterium]